MVSEEEEIRAKILAEMCLNPYFVGRWFLRRNEKSVNEYKDVLILILLEDGF